jgi:phosphoglycolate phosphatase
VYHLLFDLDGTLTDPAPGISACYLHAARAMGHGSLSEADVRRFIGPPLRESFREILKTDEPSLIEEAVRLYRDRFASVGLFENTVYPGIPRVLAQLRDDGFELRVVTSKAKIYADRIIDHFMLREFFPSVYGAELSGERSSKTELLAQALQLEAIEPRRACMIGDRLHDIVGGKVHALATIGVAWGYGSVAELEAAGADCVVDTLGGLLVASHALLGV